jgi:hypothetical protein
MKKTQKQQYIEPEPKLTAHQCSHWWCGLMIFTIAGLFVMAAYFGDKYRKHYKATTGIEAKFWHEDDYLLEQRGELYRITLPNGEEVRGYGSLEQWAKDLIIAHNDNLRRRLTAPRIERPFVPVYDKPEPAPVPVMTNTASGYFAPGTWMRYEASMISK